MPSTTAKKETTMTPQAAIMEELDHRESNGIAVSLLWQRHSNRLAVVVEDTKLGEFFTIDVGPDNAGDVFHHPYAYAAPRLAA
jgi:hypothetical protein